MTTFDVDAQQKISPYLESGERLIWSGRPGGGIRFRTHDLLLVPFGLVWCAITLGSLWATLTRPASGPGSLFGILFLLVGFHLVIGRFFTDAWSRGRTVYGLTDRRVVILSGFFSRTLSSIFLQNLVELSLKEGRRGEGTIYLGRPMPPVQLGEDYKTTPALEFLPDAAQVYRLMQEAKAKSQR
jgi:hypothetical protein